MIPPYSSELVIRQLIRSCDNFKRTRISLQEERYIFDKKALHSIMPGIYHPYALFHRIKPAVMIDVTCYIYIRPLVSISLFPEPGRKDTIRTFVERSPKTLTVPSESASFTFSEKPSSVISSGR